MSAACRPGRWARGRQRGRARGQGVDLTAVMAAIHEFFVGLGVDEIRRRGAADDKPLRMVKTLLHELCKHEVRAPRSRQPRASPRGRRRATHVQTLRM
jgi:hypothetical protein